MKGALAALLMSAVVLISVNAALAAAGNQPFFSGTWSCQASAAGQNVSSTLRVAPAFGPWFSYNYTSGSNTAQAYLYNDRNTGAWVRIGVDSSGGYWSETSSGWHGNQMIFQGPYTNYGRSSTHRSVITKTGDNSWRQVNSLNGVEQSTTACTKR